MRIGTGLVKLVVAAVVLTSVSAAMAQGGGGRGGRGISPLLLLGLEGVQTELKLSAEQKDSVTKLAGAQPSFQDQRNLSEEERTKLAADTQKKVDEILLPPQRERLMEITLQVAGARALTRPEVATKLKLSDDQKKQVADVFAAVQGGGGGGGQAAREEANNKALAVLTAEQKDQFVKMQGTKLEIDMSQLRGRGQGGGKGKKGGPNA